MNRKIVLSAVSVLAFVILAQHKAFACSCATDELGTPLATKVNREKNWSDAIFTGRVLNITENYEKEYLLVEIEVIATWKGTFEAKTTILTGLHDGNCRFRFKVGETYLIYGRSNGMYMPESLSTDMCSRTALYKDSRADIKLLGNQSASIRRDG